MDTMTKTMTKSVTNTQLAVATLALLGAGGLALATIPLSQNQSQSNSSQPSTGDLCGVKEFKGVRACAGGYKLAYVKCYDGTVTTTGDNVSCQSAGQLKQLAARACEGRCTAPPPTVRECTQAMSIGNYDYCDNNTARSARVFCRDGSEITVGGPNQSCLTLSQLSDLAYQQCPRCLEPTPPPSPPSTPTTTTSTITTQICTPGETLRNCRNVNGVLYTTFRFEHYCAGTGDQYITSAFPCQNGTQCQDGECRSTPTVTPTTTPTVTPVTIRWASDTPSGVSAPAVEQTIARLIVSNNSNGRITIKKLTPTPSYSIRTFRENRPRRLNVYHTQVTSSTLLTSVFGTLDRSLDYVITDELFTDVDIEVNMSKTFIVTFDTSDATSNSVIDVRFYDILWSDSTNLNQQIFLNSLLGKTLTY